MNNYFISLYKILKLIEHCSYQDHFDYSLFSSENLNLSDKELKIILTNALNENLISGIVLFPNMPGFKAINPHLTTNGYHFLEENSSMKKAYALLKEAKEWIPGF